MSKWDKFIMIPEEEEEDYIGVRISAIKTIAIGLVVASLLILALIIFG